MSLKINRRRFTVATTGLFIGGVSGVCSDQEPATQENQDETAPRGPVEAAFERDYEPPKFKPSWKNQQVNRTMAQDFVIFAHDNLEMVQSLYDREPGLLNATIDWGAGDWETALGGASHMGRKDIVGYLLGKGARMDIFCAAMMGMLDTVKAMLAVEPELINARGPHGIFNLHQHAYIASQIGHDQGELLDHLQSIKEKEIRKMPFLSRRREGNSDD